MNQQFLIIEPLLVHILTHPFFDHYMLQLEN